MKLAMLATTAVATTTLLMSLSSRDSAMTAKCDEMLAIQDIVVLCENEDRSNEINQIYREVLGREADPQGLQTWSQKLSRRNTINDIRREIAESDEAKLVLNRIYLEVLGRNVDRSGLKTYTKNLKRNWTLSDVRRDIQRSEEAMSRRVS